GLTLPDGARFRLDLVELADLARRWCSLTTQAEADVALRALLDRDALSVLNGLAWLLAAWSLVGEARTGVTADQVIRSLDYQGRWRQTNTEAEQEAWTKLTGI